MERRLGERFVVDIPISMTAANATSMNRALLVNLSITGALIKSDFRPRVLSRVQIVFGSLSRQGQGPSIAAYVTQNHLNGIGVEWCEQVSSVVVTELVRAARAQSPSEHHAKVVGSAPSTMPLKLNSQDLQAKSFLFIKWIANMNALLDGPSAPNDQSPLEASGLRMPAETKMAAVIPDSMRWTRSAHQNMIAIRHARIAKVAYSMAETRGFVSGHDTDDWLRAQSEVNAQDAGTFQL